jgi:probable F420-dependent oxidoreductase
MLFGACLFFTDTTIAPDELGVALENCGFDSVWVGEHTHIPVSLSSAQSFPLTVTPAYWHTLDPFVSLTAVASATTTLRLATGICLLVQRDPIVTAKEVATLDYLSGGRVLFGVGAGWNAEEMAGHGTSYKRRYRLLEERLALMREIWTSDEASFDGRFHHLEPSWAYPKPIQSPHPPIYIGGNGPRASEILQRQGAHWLPAGSPDDWPEIASKIARLRQERPSDAEPLRVSIVADAMPTAELLNELVSVGVERLVIDLGAPTREEALRTVDELAPMITKHEL